MQGASLYIKNLHLAPIHFVSVLQLIDFYILSEHDEQSAIAKNGKRFVIFDVGIILKSEDLCHYRFLIKKWMAYKSLESKGLVFIGKDFNEALDTTKLPRKEIADRMGMDSSQLSKMLGNANRMTLIRLEGLLGALEVLPIIILLDKAEVNERCIRDLEKKYKQSKNIFNCITALLEEITDVNVKVIIYTESTNKDNTCDE